MKNRKAMSLMELSVFILASFIMLMAVSTMLSSNNTMISTFNRNNTVLFLADSLKNKAMFDFNNGLTPAELNVDEYTELVKDSSFKVELVPNEDNSAVEISITIDLDNIHTRVYALEVKKHEK